MIFSSLLFLFLFLPGILILYYSAAIRTRNFVLLTASLLFYTWGEGGYVLLMLFSIVINWLVGLSIEKARSYGKSCRLILGAGIFLNLAPLVFFKYGNFFVETFNGLLAVGSLKTITLAPIHLPIGISFFTFQAISYIVDVYRNQVDAQRQPINLGLYIALFPQLIAGPIVRYRDVALEIANRSVTLNCFQYGIQRFVTGLGKKVLIANNVGAVADHIFSLPSETLPAGFLWLGMIAYSLQIYYDFSGYSDMAIGLGRMFGFRFLENFNYPYSATSIQDFWRRWHISLSSWFKDYLYIPLGGNRKGGCRTYFNLLTVFFFCGFWHGASWNFIVWGLYHGLFLVLERCGLGRILGELPRFIQHTYTAIVFMVGWVFFRAESLPRALDYLAGLGNFNTAPYLDARLFATINNEFYLALAIGIVFMFPVAPKVLAKIYTLGETGGNTQRTIYATLMTVIPVLWVSVIIIYSSAQLISGTHNPFLYFRF
ncbi:MAG: MBOAT family protein [Proteobacteria bacterium]|nr:MBOAT family protein [Pseudomonadota bacterium]